MNKDMKAQVLNLREELNVLDAILREAQAVSNCPKTDWPVLMLKEGESLSSILDYCTGQVKSLQVLAKDLLNELCRVREQLQ